MLSGVARYPILRPWPEAVFALVVYKSAATRFGNGRIARRDRGGALFRRDSAIPLIAPTSLFTGLRFAPATVVIKIREITHHGRNTPARAPNMVAVIQSKVLVMFVMMTCDSTTLSARQRETLVAKLHHGRNSRNSVLGVLLLCTECASRSTTKEHAYN